MKKSYLILVIAIILASCKPFDQETVSKQNRAENNLSNIKAETLKTAVIAGGEIQRIDNFPSVYTTPRPVDVWLPNNYSEDKKYSVLYMHDGQNLFDSNTTENQQEWMVDEIATKLMDDNNVRDFIVVGVHSIAKTRWRDLFPEKALGYLKSGVNDSIFQIAINANVDAKLKGDDYLKFMVDEVKPFIDATYSTKKDQANTFVSGSGMGGLMAAYAVCEYPKVFGGAACLSTHWTGTTPEKDNPVPKAIFAYLTKSLPSPKDHKFYFDFGTKTMDQYYPQYEDTVTKIFTDAGYDYSNFRNVKFEGADHSENAWQKRFDIPLTFLLGK